jgi:molybdate transport system ATP-binding protein
MSLHVDIRKKLARFELNVKFDLEKGVFAILGASGCGKSMTLKCIAGIETPDEGQIVLDGRVLFDSKRKINLPPQKRQVGYMFQDYALFPNMTVEENIMAGMEKSLKGRFMTARAKKRVLKPEAEKYIERFRLNGLEGQYPSKLSGGQKQRVAMARMLAAKPEIILLDEPFSALDSYLRDELEQEMGQLLQESGKPALFVSHNRDEVYRLCDLVSCLDQGQMEPPVPVKTFFHYPGTVTAAKLSGCKNIAAVTRRDGGKWRAGAWKVSLQVPDGAQPEAVGIRAHSFYPADASAENAILIGEYRIVEEPFEWSIYFRSDKECSWLLWRLPKAEWESLGASVPQYLAVKPEEVLCLRGKC